MKIFNHIFQHDLKHQIATAAYNISFITYLPHLNIINLLNFIVKERKDNQRNEPKNQNHNTRQPDLHQS